VVFALFFVRFVPRFVHFSTLMMNDDLLPDLIAAVEQQLVSPQTPYVAKTLARLTKLGIAETEAKTQIALCLGGEMDAILRTRKPFDEKSYRAGLDALPLPDDEETDAPAARSEFPPPLAPETR
jgi:hypothetical protein